MKQIFKMMGWAVMACAVAACSAKKEEGEAKVEEKPKVKIMTATQREVEQTEQYTATVESDVKNNISSNSPLRIERILVDVGQQVRRGQVLVQMDASSLHQLKLQIDNQKIDFKRTDELYKVGGVSKAEWDNARTQLEVNETAYHNMLTNTQLISPINGVVTARNYDNGDMSGTLPILTVETLSPVKMLINVNEGHYPDVKKGMPASVQLDTYGEECFAGKVSIVYPTIDATTHTFPVEITLTNSDGRVRPGMFARATLSFGKENHVVVPDQAIVKQMGAGDYYVYTYQPDGTVRYNKVQIGRRLNNEYEIVSGVENNASVVVAGQKKLNNGMAVEVVK